MKSTRRTGERRLEGLESAVTGAAFETAVA
jgi:hypothetical protein